MLATKYDIIEDLISKARTDNSVKHFIKLLINGKVKRCELEGNILNIYNYLIAMELITEEDGVVFLSEEMENGLRKYVVRKK